jgi:hypothetical protein
MNSLDCMFEEDILYLVRESHPPSGVALFDHHVGARHTTSLNVLQEKELHHITTKT